MNNEAKVPSQEKPIHRNLNITRETLIDMAQRIEKFNDLINRVSNVDASKKRDSDTRDALTKEVPWEECNLEQKIDFNKSMADNNLCRLREVGDRLNSLV